ncbi:hypothetical protein [Microbacterium paulum]
MNVTFGELVEFAVGGGWGEDQPSDGMVPVRVMRGADFPAAESRDLSSAPLRYEPSKKAASRILREGDIVLEVSGGTKDRPTGRSIFASPQLLSSVDDDVIPASFCRLVRIDRTKASPAFVYYALQDLYNRGGTWEFQNQSTGIANFQFELFRERWRLDLPSLSEQQAIAEVLGALDDKIAANTAFATSAVEFERQTFYKSIRSTEAATTTVGAVLEHKAGKHLAKSDYVESGRYVVYGSNSVMGFHDRANVCGPFAVLARIGSNSGALHWSHTDAWVNNNASGLVARSGVDPHLLRFALDHIDMSIHSAGSGQPFIRIESLMSATIAWPPADQLVRLAEGIRAACDLELALQTESRTLAATRDALLPQLMSGKLRVRDAEDLIVQAGA